VFTLDTRSRRRQGLTALMMAGILFSGACGGGDDDGGTGGDDTDEPSAETTSGDEGCRTELVEDEYGFEVEIEVCDE